jgi:glycine/D-amino acid oxidase-like deaminating enzyme
MQQFFPASFSFLRTRMLSTILMSGTLISVPDGTPLIGPVPGVPGLLLATGHEGSGLYLALGTAEMVVGMITGIEGPVNSTPYSPAGRLSF